METLRSATLWFAIDDPTSAGAARRAAIALARHLGFSEARTAEAGIVASEAASNVHRHAGAGAVGVQVVLRSGQAGVQILALDQGPGMADLPRSQVDGHSTGGTLGLGLGAITRLASALDVSTEPGRGTVLVAELWDAPRLPAGILDLGAVTRAIAGETVCGDAVGGRELGGYHLFLVADGLGHGPLAAAASQEALQGFHEARGTQPVAILAELHGRLARTRGAAVGVAVIDPAYRLLSFAGAGNISAFVAGAGRRRSVPSTPGIIGHRSPKLRQVDLELEDGAIVVLHSDGVRDAWDLALRPGLRRRSAAVIAACLLRDFGNRPDDASVLVARQPR